jgi:DNA repair exonuclease SbcCD ATPase subunit
MEAYSSLLVLREQLNEAKVGRDILKAQLKSEKILISEKKSYLGKCEKARTIIQHVAEKVQKTLEYRISDMVTTALQAVLPNPEEFQLEFKKIRNKTECFPWFVKDGKKSRPIYSSGGGALDVASFALRCAIWSIRKTRPVFILDEPFKYVWVGYQDKCSEMVKRITEKLGIQVIMISHLPKINVAADNTVKVDLKGDIAICS